MNVGSLARGVRGSSDWRNARDRLDKAIQRKPSAALKFAKALDEDLRRHGYDIAVSSLRHHTFVSACQGAGKGSTAVAIKLGARAPMQHPSYRQEENLRFQNAMQIVGSRPAAEISHVIDRDEDLRREDPEFGLLLAQELVLRGAEPSPGAVWYADWASRTRHPLSVLPLQLLEIEHDLPSGLPHFPGAQGSSSWPTTSESSDDYRPLGELLPGLGSETSLPTAALAPFQDWLDHSNGQVRVVGYHQGDSYPAGLSEPQIRANCLATLIPASIALRSLFIAASGGGAYSASPGSAFARLHVWTALAALMEKPATTPIDQVAKAAADARWIRLDTEDEWFHDVAWDVWMIVDDGQRVVSIAATDTD